ncbi:MAG TPA: hypothetical protein VGM88_17325 [Kofleriaceae bacterium]|jgi:hypothetical protein
MSLVAVAVALELAKALLPGAPSCTDVPCLIAHAYAADVAARDAALALWTDRGDLAGVGPDEDMDGGYRGHIHLVPNLPAGADRVHLARVAAAAAGFDAFFAALFPKGTPQPSYRWREIAFRFVRSVGKRTPSAYATHWIVEYNVAGSLLGTSDGVAETLFHELFHSNDEQHGNWSRAHLGADYDAILARCRHRAVSCLDPYAPNATKVRGGTYYAFQENNGDTVHEYAAELAVRYWKEQREMLAVGRLSHTAFKCGPPENARAWDALVTEFFAGRDLVPPCAGAHRARARAAPP